MAEPTASYTDDQLNGDGVSKKELVTYLQTWATIPFQQEHKLKGQVKNIAKKSKDALIADYKAMWETKAFMAEGEAAAAADTAEAVASAKVDEVTKKARNLSLSEDTKDEGPPKYRKVTIKKGDKINFPKKGDYVLVYYKGMLEDGTVFDQNITGGKRGNRKQQPFKFKVGKGLVIRGWDHVLMTMCCGEKIELTIEPEWAYGRRGLEGKIPANATLKFELELCSIE